MANIKVLRLAHELDAAWIIALWKAIHGGDPAPEQIAVEAIAALSGALTRQTETEISKTSVAELQSRLKEVGVELHVETKGSAKAVPSERSRIIRTYCVVFQGKKICIELPRPNLWRVEE
jgi:hypothetical protein